MEIIAADRIAREHRYDRLVLIDGGISMPAAFGIDGERLLQLMGQTEVVDHQATGLVLENAVYAGDGLHEAVAAHGFVDIHRVQTGRVEAGEPHVAHDDDFEGVLRILEPLCQLLPSRLVTDVRLPRERIGLPAGHDDLHNAFVVGVGVPLGAKLAQGLIQLEADAPAHADDHRLAVHDLQARLPMLHEVGGDQAQAFVGADDGLQRRPLGLEPCLL